MQPKDRKLEHAVAVSKSSAEFGLAGCSNQVDQTSRLYAATQMIWVSADPQISLGLAGIR